MRNHRVVRGWGNLERSTDRLDTPAQPTVGPVGVLGDEPHERCKGRSSSAAKKADAAWLF